MLLAVVSEPVLYLGAVGVVMTLVPLMMRSDSAATSMAQRGAQVVGVIMLAMAGFGYWTANQTADWQRYPLPDRRCSVEFPTKPSTTSESSSLGMQYEGLKVRGFAGDTFFYAASCPIPDVVREASTDQILTAIREGIHNREGPAGDPMRITSQYQVTRNGTFGQGLNITSGEFRLSIHYYRVGQRLYEMHAAWHESVDKAIADRFLASPKFGRAD